MANYRRQKSAVSTSTLCRLVPEGQKYQARASRNKGQQDGYAGGVES
ncbi:hypothetical protein Q8A64_04910 [Oxalobacteraceae bacterium R-40]|uniref:Uncharacterized protein n=1 Tax=Keguizhuia sedimenti TaxID=3064264 RepID=A0ABU1BN65_9BURK|nr:hypothetical protein [Oxalobacteraceae bacterium R-40]